MSEAGALREIFALFDVSFNTDELDRGAAAVDTLAGKLKQAVKAFAGFTVVKSVIGWGEHIAEAARQVEFGAIKAGMGTEEFQKLNQVAEKYGTTAEQLTISTRLFVRSLRDAGGTAAEFHSHSKLAADAFHDLGINAAQFKGKSISEILPIVADGFQKIGKGTRATADALVLFGHRGIGILPLLLKGGENLRKEMQAMQPVFEDATIEAADRAVLSGKALGFTWEHLINNVFGRPLLNALTKGADALDRIVKGAYELMKASEIGNGALVALGAALTAAGIAGAIAFWSWLWPLAAAVAAFVALALAVDDFIVFMRGGDSLLGDFFDQILGPGGAEKAQQFFKDIWDTIKGFLADLKESSWKEFVEGTKDWAHNIVQGFRDVKEIIEFILGSAKALDDVFHLLGIGGTKDTVKGPKGTAESSSFINPGVGLPPVELPPMIGPPTLQQSIQYGPQSGGSTTLVIPVDARGNLTQDALVNSVREGVRHAVDEHNGRALRDAGASFGGAQ